MATAVPCGGVEAFISGFRSLASASTDEQKLQRATVDFMSKLAFDDNFREFNFPLLRTHLTNYMSLDQLKALVESLKYMDRLPELPKVWSESRSNILRLCLILDTMRWGMLYIIYRVFRDQRSAVKHFGEEQANRLFLKCHKLSDVFYDLIAAYTSYHEDDDLMSCAGTCPDIKLADVRKFVRGVHSPMASEVTLDHFIARSVHPPFWRTIDQLKTDKTFREAAINVLKDKDVCAWCEFVEGKSKDPDRQDFAIVDSCDHTFCVFCIKHFIMRGIDSFCPEAICAKHIRYWVRWSTLLQYWYSPLALCPPMAETGVLSGSSERTDVVAGSVEPQHNRASTVCPPTPPTERTPSQVERSTPPAK